MVRTLAAAGRWVDKVGLALLFPKADVVLPSLWEQVNGDAETNWAVRDDEGNFVAWSEEMGFLWGAKDELPERGLVCVGKHLARVTACVAPRLVPALIAACGVEPEDEPVISAIRDLGPLTGPQLREATGLPKKEVDRRVAALHYQLVLTSSHLVEQDGPWGALAHDLIRRKWKAKKVPERSAARRELAGLVLGQAGELTAADVAGIFKWRRKEAAAVLDEIAESRDGGGFRIWAQP
ncbi:MAG TPA: crosslink repair DNA glycosylase YcaQ family protein [Gaiellaceae bacterium]|nr:crosslink repair DNA glycosylase YcaQ family protein [Gaiellaceae bacterium]